jgi:hypothetical protein
MVNVSRLNDVRCLFVISLATGYWIESTIGFILNPVMIPLSRRSASNHPHTSSDIMIEQDDDCVVGTNRRNMITGTFSCITAATVTLLSSSDPAGAFENKISNQYDDRPKQRGSQVSEISQVMTKTQLPPYQFKKIHTIAVIFSK